MSDRLEDFILKKDLTKFSFYSKDNVKRIRACPGDKLLDIKEEQDTVYVNHIPEDEKFDSTKIGKIITSSNSNKKDNDQDLSNKDLSEKILAFEKLKKKKIKSKKKSNINLSNTQK